MTSEDPHGFAAFVSVGSNIDPGASIEGGLRALAGLVRIVDISMLYTSRPTERSDQADFVNGVWQIETDRDPWSLKFDVLREVEYRLGRTRSGDKHAARTLDLDLILYGEEIIRSDELVLPDPDIYNAHHVIFPLAQLAPELILPDTKIRVRDISGAADPSGLSPLPAMTAALKGWLNK